MYLKVLFMEQYRSVDIDLFAVEGDSGALNADIAGAVDGDAAPGGRNLDTAGPGVYLDVIFHVQQAVLFHGDLPQAGDGADFIARHLFMAIFSDGKYLVIADAFGVVVHDPGFAVIEHHGGHVLLRMQRQRFTAFGILKAQFVIAFAFVGFRAEGHLGFAARQGAGREVAGVIGAAGETGCPCSTAAEN